MCVRLLWEYFGRMDNRRFTGKGTHNRKKTSVHKTLVSHTKEEWRCKKQKWKARCPLRKLALLGMIALHEFVKRSTKIVQNSSLNPKSICTKCCNRQHLSLFLSLTQSRKNITCMLHQMQFITILISKQFLAKITFQSTFAGFLVTKMFF